MTNDCLHLSEFPYETNLIHTFTPLFILRKIEYENDCELQAHKAVGMLKVGWILNDRGGGTFENAQLLCY